MPIPDHIRASAYARQRLQHELAPQLRYHSLAHTRDDVVPAVMRLAKLIGVDEADQRLLHTAAWYHDLGFAVQRDDHEAVGARIAATTLPRFGYSDDQIARIMGMIAATRLPQTPQSLLEELLADGDLDSLGRDDFLTTSLNLRTELYLYGTTIPELEWYARQLDFLTSHRYWTAAARSLRDMGKQQNIVLLGKLLQDGESGSAKE